MISPTLLSSNACFAETAENKVKLFGRIDRLSAACGAAGVVLESRQMPTKILKVRLGSPASYAGLAVDDEVLSGAVSGDIMRLKILRSGKNYSVDLKIEPEKGHVETLSASVRNSGHKLAAVVDKQALEATRIPDWALLSRYQIAVLLDRSGSMAESAESSDVADVSGGESLSRWRWCSDQIQDFASESRRMSHENLTFCIFNHEFIVNRNCDLSKMKTLMENLKPEGGTDFANPIKSIADNFFAGARQKPLLICVVTDCETNGGARVEAVIKRIAAQMRRADEVKIVIFQIGNTGDGADFAWRLDNDMVKNGARFDIVKSFYYDDLRLAGLRRGLVRAVQERNN